MLNKEKLDAVCLLVPESIIAALSIKLLRLGYPLMMEKPPGRNKDETMAMIEAAKKTIFLIK